MRDSRINAKRLKIRQVLATGYAATGIIDLHHDYEHHTLTISAHDFKVRAPVSIL